MTNRLTLLLSLTVLATALALPKQAAAHDHFDLSVGIGGPTYVAPTDVTPGPVVVAPAVERRWIPGHYETRVTNVLVEPERREREWVPPASRVRIDPYGCRVTVTTPGFYRDILIPARYESRETRIWIEGFYQDIAVAAPPTVVYRRPAFSFGGFFRF